MSQEDRLVSFFKFEAAVGGAARSWTTIDDFMQEVINARIYDGGYYRNSGRAGGAMRKRIGNLAAKKYQLTLFQF